MHAKSWLIMAILGMAILVIPAILGGCSSGVSQEEYQTVSNQLANTRNELDTLKAQVSQQAQQGNAKAHAYAEVQELCLEPWLLLAGEKTKGGYTASAADTNKWIADIDKRIKAIDDAVLTTLWKSYLNTTNNTEKTKIGIRLMSYVSDKIMESTK
jgi:BMFP domain-containing protein YqiC